MKGQSPSMEIGMFQAIFFILIFIGLILLVLFFTGALQGGADWVTRLWSGSR